LRLSRGVWLVVVGKGVRCEGELVGGGFVVPDFGTPTGSCGLERRIDVVER
jgi:hypothetical protein